MRPLYVLGSSGLAREVALVALAAAAGGDRWRFAGYVASDPVEIGRELTFGKVAGDDEWLLGRDDEAALVVGIGYPSVRARALARYLAAGDRFVYPNFVHPRANVDPALVKFGRGNVVTAGTVMTCDIEIGDFNLFNLNTTVGHDARVGSFNVFNPSVNLSGDVRIGDRVLVGTGAQVLEHLTVGSDATIGAGALVRAPVGSGDTVVGVPARPLLRPA